MLLAEVFPRVFLLQILVEFLWNSSKKSSSEHIDSLAVYVAASLHFFTFWPQDTTHMHAVPPFNKNLYSSVSTL